MGSFLPISEGEETGLWPEQCLTKEALLCGDPGSCGGRSVLPRAADEWEGGRVRRPEHRATAWRTWERWGSALSLQHPCLELREEGQLHVNDVAKETESGCQGLLFSPRRTLQTGDANTLERWKQMKYFPCLPIRDKLKITPKLTGPKSMVRSSAAVGRNEEGPDGVAAALPLPGGHCSASWGTARMENPGSVCDGKLLSHRTAETSRSQEQAVGRHRSLAVHGHSATIRKVNTALPLCALLLFV